jgi:hypothetical protein
MNEFMNELNFKNPELYSSILKKIISPVIIRIDKRKKAI